MREVKKIIISVLILSSALLPMQLKIIKAAGLTNVTVAPVSQNQSTATNIVVTFTPNTAITNGTILEVTYDTAFTGGAALTNADVSVAGTNISASTESNFVAGYFKSVLTTTGSVTTTVTITIGGGNQLTTPSSAGNYSWAVSADIGGGGTTYDIGAGLAYISSISIKENQVNVTSIVPPAISLDLDQSGSNTKLVDPNTCTLGVLALNTVKTCSYDVAVGTNNTAGATVKVTSNNGLTNGTYTFTGTGGSPAVAGTEGYGFWVASAGSVFTASGSYGTQSQNVPTTVQTFATSSATSSATTIGEHLGVTHEAAMSTSTATGVYSHIVSYTAFTN